jgi:hypothetical protein
MLNEMNDNSYSSIYKNDGNVYNNDNESNNNNTTNNNNKNNNYNNNNNDNNNSITSSDVQINDETSMFYHLLQATSTPTTITSCSIHSNVKSQIRFDPGMVSF